MSFQFMSRGIIIDRININVDIAKFKLDCFYLKMTEGYEWGNRGAMMLKHWR